jgi:hypothetical protein
MDDAGNAVTATSRPDLHEASRVLFGVTMRSTGVGFYLGAIALLGLFLILISRSFMPQDPVIGYGAIVIGILIIVGPVWSIRSAIRKRLRAALPNVTGSTFTFSGSGIDTKSTHSRSHYDWPAVRSGRRIREGLLFQIGQATMFMSVRYFDNSDDFERAIALFKRTLGTKFTGA